jgi:two-component system, NtrC family, sensor kinase
MLCGERLIVSTDVADEEPYRAEDPVRRALVDLGGAHSAVQVALVKDDVLLGSLTVFRQEVRPFSDKQIALLQNFAAQAVVAMENARLLDQIRRREQKLRVTFDNMGDGVAMFDGEMRLAAWNRNFELILDLPEAFVAEPRTLPEIVRFLAVRGEFGAEADPEAEVRRLVENTSRHYSYERTRPDGHILEVRHNPVPGGGFVVIYGDITERKRAEQEIRRARDAAETALGELKTAQASLIQAEKLASLGQLTAGIAHELKNPLNFVNNFAGLSVELLDELKERATPALAGLPPEQRDEIDETIETLTGNLDKIAEHGRRADNIVKGMLEHSRGASGERREVNLNALVEEALNLAYHGARAQDQNFNVTLERDYDTALRPIKLVPQDMTRVFLNLFGNGFYAANKRARAADDDAFRPVLRVATRELANAFAARRAKEPMCCTSSMRVTTRLPAFPLMTVTA